MWYKQLDIVVVGQSLQWYLRVCFVYEVCVELDVFECVVVEFVCICCGGFECLQFWVCYFRRFEVCVVDILIWVDSQRVSFVFI